jgi:hypothetical protein
VADDSSGRVSARGRKIVRLLAAAALAALVGLGAYSAMHANEQRVTQASTIHSGGLWNNSISYPEPLS